ncbi:MAG: MotA/TolQ/ExbB proton channel family protein, partial [Flavobacteriales bacterium]
MKKMFAMFALIGVLMIGFNAPVLAQPAEGSTAQDSIAAAAEAAKQEAQAAADKAKADAEAQMNSAVEEEVPEVLSFHQVVKKTFIEGGAFFMSFVLICLIFGLALAIERIIYLNMATTNTDKLLSKIEGALQSGGVEAAKDVCRNTSGPVASIFYQGLDRSTGEISDIAKAIEDYGSVEMSKLERGLSWISLFISLAPMLGFMGTVIGMISAFNDIAQANTINASIVAGGIKVALITTVSGLIVAIILQVFYN